MRRPGIPRWSRSTWCVHRSPSTCWTWLERIAAASELCPKAGKRVVRAPPPQDIKREMSFGFRLLAAHAPPGREAISMNVTAGRRHRESATTGRVPDLRPAQWTADALRRPPPASQAPAGLNFSAAARTPRLPPMHWHANTSRNTANARRSSPPGHVHRAQSVRPIPRSDPLRRSAGRDGLALGHPTSRHVRTTARLDRLMKFNIRRAVRIDAARRATARVTSLSATTISQCWRQQKSMRSASEAFCSAASADRSTVASEHSTRQRRPRRTDSGLPGGGRDIH